MKVRLQSFILFTMCLVLWQNAAFGHPCEMTFRGLLGNDPVPGVFDFASQLLKAPKVNLKSIFRNRAQSESTFFAFSKQQALESLEKVDRVLLEKLIVLNPVLGEKFDRLGIIDPASGEGLVLEVVVKAQRLESGKLQMSTGEWHADRGDSVFIYQKSDPPNLSPTKFLAATETLNRDALAEVLNAHTGSVSQQKIDSIGAVEFDIPSESFLVLKSDTLHRSQRTNGDGERYFMRISFRMRPLDFHQRFNIRR